MLRRQKNVLSQSTTPFARTLKNDCKAPCADFHPRSKIKKTNSVPTFPDKESSPELRKLSGNSGATFLWSSVNACFFAVSWGLWVFTILIDKAPTVFRHFPTNFMQHQSSDPFCIDGGNSALVMGFWSRPILRPQKHHA